MYVFAVTLFSSVAKSKFKIFEQTHVKKMSYEYVVHGTNSPQARKRVFPTDVQSLVKREAGKRTFTEVLSLPAHKLNLFFIY